MIVLSDDLTGEERDGIETIVFAWKGRVLSIDLTEENALEFTNAVEPFASRAREVPKAHLLRTLPKGRAGRPVKRRAEEPAEVEGQDPIPAVENELSALDTPKTEQGKESQALSEPESTPVTPQDLDPSDSQDSDPDMPPKKWIPFMPREGEAPSAVEAKARMWSTERGITMTSITPQLMLDWRTFYQRQIWRLDQ